MMAVQAGDELIAPGNYVADGIVISGTGAHFANYGEGTELNPIVMKSADPSDPAVLQGESMDSCANLWSVLESAGSGVINCIVHGVGYEAIHWRDGSDFGLIDGCQIYDTGLTKPRFGEAIYIGTDKGSWGNYDRDVTYVTICKCIIGPGNAAEAFDIKEGTEEITVEYNTIYATGISNSNFADSFIDLKGTRAYIRYNNFYQQGDAKLTRGIAVIDRGVELSSYEHVIHDNNFYLDTDDINMVEAYSGTADIYAWNNNRFPADGDYYSGQVLDECCPPWYSPPDDGTCFAPFNFAVAGITTTSATFSWTGGVSSISFTLTYEALDGGSPQSETGLVDDYIVVTNLEVDTVYVAQVQGICEDDVSSLSTEIGFRTLNNDVNVNNLPTPLESVVVVYDDALAFGWSEYSYTGTYDFAYSSNTREGLFAIEAIYGRYGGILLKHDGLPSDTFSYIHFWIRDDTTYGSDSPEIRLEVNSMRYEFYLDSPGWHSMLIPIDEKSITEIRFTNRSPNARTVYIDAIELWPQVDDEEDHSSTSPSEAPIVVGSGTSTSPSADGGGSGFGVCFSGRNTVVVVNRGHVRMDTINIGDWVQSASDNFSRVYSFGHLNKHAEAEYIQLHARGLAEPLELSSDHMIFVENMGAVPAGVVGVGDKLVLVDNVLATVTKVGRVIGLANTHHSQNLEPLL